MIYIITVKLKQNNFGSLIDMCWFCKVQDLFIFLSPANFGNLSYLSKMKYFFWLSPTLRVIFFCQDSKLTSVFKSKRKAKECNTHRKQGIFSMSVHIECQRRGHCGLSFYGDNVSQETSRISEGEIINKKLNQSLFCNH